MSGPRKRASTLDNVLADVRDRVRINGLDSVQHATLRPWVDGVSSNAVAARLTTEHEGVASDFRECMLAAASMAVAAVLDHDRRAFAARPQPEVQPA